MAFEMIKKQGFDVQVIRTNRRKTTCIQINTGIVTIRVPKKLSINEIDLLINSRTLWIKEKLLQQKQLPQIHVKLIIFAKKYICCIKFEIFEEKIQRT